MRLKKLSTQQLYKKSIYSHLSCLEKKLHDEACTEDPSDQVNFFVRDLK